MNRFGVEDSMDDDSSSSQASQRGRINNVNNINLPSMYSPTDSKASSISQGDGDGDDASNKDNEDHEVSNTTHYKQNQHHHPVSNEIKELFTYMDAYEPVDLELDTPLKCFMPEAYICSVGDVDPM